MLLSSLSTTPLSPLVCLAISHPLPRPSWLIAIVIGSSLSFTPYPPRHCWLVCLAIATAVVEAPSLARHCLLVIPVAVNPVRHTPPGCHACCRVTPSSLSQVRHAHAWSFNVVRRSSVMPPGHYSPRPLFNTGHLARSCLLARHSSAQLHVIGYHAELPGHISHFS